MHIKKLHSDERLLRAFVSSFFTALCSAATLKQIRRNRFIDFQPSHRRSAFPLRAMHIPLLFCGLLSSTAWSQNFNVLTENMQKRANGVLSLMAYSVVPDLASSSLSIKDISTDSPTIGMTQFAGGFTIGKSVYLEGGIAASRYDPAFVASNGTTERKIPFKWNSISVTGGVGWNFPLTDELIFRPIFNFALGRVASDLVLGTSFLEYKTGRNSDFLDNGHLDAYGLGGSLMLAYEHVRDNRQVDLELRYTNITLTSFGGATSVQGTADAQTATLYSRYRAPTGLTALDRDVRYVLEFSHSHYLGSQAGILGFDRLSTIGLGLELDSSAYDIIVTRTRLVARYMFGDDVSGLAIGLAVSF